MLAVGGIEKRISPALVVVEEKKKIERWRWSLKRSREHTMTWSVDRYFF